MTKMWRNLVKIQLTILEHAACYKRLEKSGEDTAERSKTCYYKHLEKSREDTAERSKMWTCYYTS